MPKELQEGGKRMLAAEGQPCPYCTATMIKDHPKLKPTRDHVKPRSIYGPKRQRGGRYIIVCAECNLMKSNMTLEQFLYYLVSRNKTLVGTIDVNVERMRQIRYLIAIGLE